LIPSIFSCLNQKVSYYLQGQNFEDFELKSRLKILFIQLVDSHSSGKFKCVEGTQNKSQTTFSTNLIGEFVKKDGINMLWKLYFKL